MKKGPKEKYTVISNTYSYHSGLSLPLDTLGKTPINTNGNYRSGQGERPPTVGEMHLSLDVHQEHFIKPHRCTDATESGMGQCWVKMHSQQGFL